LGTINFFTCAVIIACIQRSIICPGIAHLLSTIPGAYTQCVYIYESLVVL